LYFLSRGPHHPELPQDRFSEGTDRNWAQRSLTSLPQTWSLHIWNHTVHLWKEKVTIAKRKIIPDFTTQTLVNGPSDFFPCIYKNVIIFFGTCCFVANCTVWMPFHFSIHTCTLLLQWLQRRPWLCPHLFLISL
jgi:hypothetical protein